MKKTIKKLLPEKIKNYIIDYMNNQLISNYFKKNNQKYALLSYILTPFKKDSLSHTNFFEAQSWAKVLDELGYNVDIIDYRNTKNLDLSKYDLICGFGDVFQKVFESDYHNKTKTIYYGTGMHVCHQNTTSLQRVKDVYNKKGVWLGKSARFVEKTWTHQTALVDGIIALGNEVCADSYRKYYEGIVYSLPAPFYETQNGENIIKQRGSASKQHYLWFGSSGLIHKGLDLCLDYFSQNQDIFLHICGPIENEPDFVATYQKELFESQNIKLHGFIDIASKEFENILTMCSFIIFPSCSEGGSPSTLTVIGNGGLIPIITKETTIDTGYEIWINGFDNESIDKAVQYSQSLTNEQLKELQYKNLSYVQTQHTQEIYYNELKKNIKQILGQKNDL
ncbi:hypothetical protein Q6A78_01515 [Aliarcobacter skirrowii]|uniref:hypothetical protein n=1 Tax=Aliarcobacter skirrowii TaxID=28200 RepID=UPI0029B7840C|nr:hypothetical protein [Aliarcobacter skirrowii]MDX3959075.1 hypothetical protein [Aliarcobacter skirrowii]